jgi:hypothetical protein
VKEEKRSVKESAQEEARRIEERKRQADLYAERRSEELSKVEILFEQGIRQSQGAYRKVARKDPEHGGGLLTLEPVKDVYVSTSFWQVSFINHSDQPINFEFFDIREVLDATIYDAAGKRLPALIYDPNSHRKVSGMPRIAEPGGKYSTPISFFKWAEITEPGNYRAEFSTKWVARK